MPTTVTPAVLADAAARFGVGHHLVALEREGAPDGAVYPCERAGVRAFLKLRPVTAGTLPRERARLALQEHLRDRMAVLTYLPSLDGEQLEVVADRSGALHVVTLTERAPGRHLTMPADLTPEIIRRWAGTLGRIHAGSRTWRGGDALPDWQEEHSTFLAGCRDEAVGRVWIELGAAMAQLPKDPACFGVVHNDLHSGNLLLASDGTLTVLDFDVAARHWHATDLAILLAHPLWDLRRSDPAEAQPFVDTAVAAYLEEYPLPAGRLADVPLLMRYRLCLLVLAIQAELAGAPMSPWLLALRRWVLSGEPLADVRL